MKIDRSHRLKPMMIILRNRRSPNGVRSGRHERGTVLMLAILISVLMAMVALPYMTKLSGRFKASERIADTLAARYLAEAGVERAIWELNYGNISGWSGSSSQRTMTMTDVQSSNGTVIGNVSIVVNNPFDGDPVIEATGSVVHTGSATINKTVRALVSSDPNVYNFAMFGTKWVHIRESSDVDSYDSSLGAYGGDNVHANATVGANTPGGDRVEIKDTSTVHGNAYCGYLDNPLTEIAVDPGAVLTGTKSALTAAKTVDPAVAPTGLPNLGNIKVEGGSTVNISSSAKYGTFEIAAKSTVNITSDVTLHLTTKLKVGDDCTLNVANGAKLTVILDSNDSKALELAGGARLLTASQKPADFSILGTNACTGDLFFDAAAADFYGNVYLPLARFHFNGPTHVFGSVIAKEFELKSQTQFHYDEALSAFLPSGVPNPGGGLVTVKMWQGTL